MNNDIIVGGPAWYGPVTENLRQQHLLAHNYLQGLFLDTYPDLPSLKSAGFVSRDKGWWNDHAVQHRAFDAAFGLQVEDFSLGDTEGPHNGASAPSPGWMQRHALRHALYSQTLAAEGI